MERIRYLAEETRLEGEKSLRFIVKPLNWWKLILPVRRFKEQVAPQADLEEILTAGQMASSGKFQSYSVILVRSQERKDALWIGSTEAIRQSAAFCSLLVT